MKVFLLILFGFLSGIVGGMGMGGGTLLVPLLSFLDIPQKTIQAINLVSFLPMCVVALAIHAKNKLVKPKGILWVVIPACIFAFAGAFFAGKAQDRLLRICFGFFLIAVGIWQLIVATKPKRKRYTVVYSRVRCLKSKYPLLQDEKSNRVFAVPFSRKCIGKQRRKKNIENNVGRK